MKDTSLKLTREEVETYTRVSRKTVANFFYNMEDLEFIVKESKGHYNISGLVLHLSRKTKE